MLTTRPQPRSYILGRAERMSRNGASTMTASTTAKRSGGNASTGATCCSPALLTRMSAVRSSRSTASRSDRSATTALAPSSPATRSAPARSTSSTVTSAPARASRRAQASPMPLAAPVTTAARPLRSVPTACPRTASSMPAPSSASRPARSRRRPGREVPRTPPVTPGRSRARRLDAMNGLHLGVILPNYGEALDAGRLARSALAAERAGLDSGWLTDHVLPPVRHAAVYGTIAEALVALGYLAGRTQRIRLGVSALVVPQREPLLALKQLVTLDFLSGGRLITAVTAGWMDEEFATLGASFEDRGRRLDDWLGLVRSLMRQAPGGPAGPQAAADGQGIPGTGAHRPDRAAARRVPARGGRRGGPRRARAVCARRPRPMGGREAQRLHRGGRRRVRGQPRPPGPRARGPGAALRRRGPPAAHRASSCPVGPDGPSIAGLGSCRQRGGSDHRDEVWASKLYLYEDFPRGTLA